MAGWSQWDNSFLILEHSVSQKERPSGARVRDAVNAGPVPEEMRDPPDRL